MKKLLLAVVLLVLIGLGVFYYAYVADRGPGVELSNGLIDLGKPETVEYVVEDIATGLEVPWSIVFTSAERMLVTERPGRLRVIENGELVATPLHTFPEVSTIGEEGLMSVVLDPDYDQNKYLYVSVAYESERGMFVKVVRFTDQGSSLANETIILDAIPAAKYHAGCRLAFGPEGKLYITTGDALDRNQAQDLNSLAGKILRINADGTIPSDNPIAGSLIWSYGHRNPQGLAWDASGQLYSSEHGPSVIDGPRGGDEVNKILKGANYGWPLVSHEKTLEGTEPAEYVFTPAEAPASLLIYSGESIPQFEGDFFFGALVGEGVVRMVPDGEGYTVEKLFTDYGRIREVVEGPDGSMYFSTSNRDGRGNPKTGDDHIYRIRALD
jgi:aldose sugar dehydrogenase